MEDKEINDRKGKLAAINKEKKKRSDSLHGHPRKDPAVTWWPGRTVLDLFSRLSSSSSRACRFFGNRVKNLKKEKKYSGSSFRFLSFLYHLAAGSGLYFFWRIFIFSNIIIFYFPGLLSRSVSYLGARDRKYII